MQKMDPMISKWVWNAKNEIISLWLNWWNHWTNNEGSVSEGRKNRMNVATWQHRAKSHPNRDFAVMDDNWPLGPGMNDQIRKRVEHWTRWSNVNHLDRLHRQYLDGNSLEVDVYRAYSVVIGGSLDSFKSNDINSTRLDLTHSPISYPSLIDNLQSIHKQKVVRKVEYERWN